MPAASRASPAVLAETISLSAVAAWNTTLLRPFNR